MKRRARGYTLTELMVGMAIMAVACAAFAGFLAGIMKSNNAVVNESEAQEQARQAMMKMEEYMLHANQFVVATSTFAQYIVDIDQSPNYDPNAVGCSGLPNYLSADMACTANLLVGATAQWTVGYNLKNDDEDKDGKIDVEERIYYSNGGVWFDMSLDEAPWGGTYLKELATDVSTFTFTYWGDKALPVDKNIDFNNDGVISEQEMDQAGNDDGSLDTPQELGYITYVRIDMGVTMHGETYDAETDVYPPLLPLKYDSP